MAKASGSAKKHGPERRRQWRKLHIGIDAQTFVKPYVKGKKHDAADAEAICEAVTRPTMRFVPIKNVEQQAVLSMHRVRQSFVRARAAQANQIRGLLSEFGLIVPQGIAHITERVPTVIEDASNDLPGSFRILVDRLLDHFKALQAQILLHRSNPASKRLEQIPGIGPITASALIASLGDARSFKDGRQVAAWLGMIPKQHSSGGKQNLLGISKRGDTYLRTLLIKGGRSVVYHADQPNRETAGATCQWVGGVAQRRNKNIAAVALANKNARICWALLAGDKDYEERRQVSAI